MYDITCTGIIFIFKPISNTLVILQELKKYYVSQTCYKCIYVFLNILHFSYQQLFIIDKTMWFTGILENYLKELLNNFLKGVYRYDEYIKVHK